LIHVAFKVSVLLFRENFLLACANRASERLKMSLALFFLYSKPIMTQEIVQYVEASGVSYPEYRTIPEVECNEYRITVEITKQLPAGSDYSYKDSDFVWGDLVVKNKQREYCLTNSLDLQENLDVFEVCALELVEHKSRSGLLLENPYWRYGIRCLDGTKEMVWFDEWELIRLDIARGEFEVF
jgi:hypothetical protein